MSGKRINYNGLNWSSAVQFLTGQEIIHGCICCPFHDDDTPSCHINDGVTSDKKGFHCYGCGEEGHPAVFVSKLKCVKENQALEILEEFGLQKQIWKSSSLSDNLISDKKEKIKKHLVEKNAKSIIGIYEFYDSAGKVSYYKVKYFDFAGRKVYLHCRFDENDDLVFNIDGFIILPYNLYNLEKALKFPSNNKIFITEGEKDAETIMSFDNSYVVTSLVRVIAGKNSYRTSHFDLSYKTVDKATNNEIEISNIEMWRNATVYFCGDTGKAGEKYREEVWNVLGGVVKNFYVIELPGVKKLGDNKDITDWVESYKDFDEAKKFFDVAFKDVWNWTLSREWRHMIKDKRGNYHPSQTSVHNVQYYLENAGISIKYEVVTGDVTLKGAVSTWKNSNGTLNRAVIRDLICRAGCKIDRDVVGEALDYISEANSYNYFQEICVASSNENYDLIDDLVSCLNLPNDFQKRIFKRWLFSYVNQGFNSIENDFVVQGALVIRGKQGIGKSTFVKSLALNDEKLYLCSDGLSFENPDSVKKHTSRNLVEITENFVNSKKEVEGFKSFMSKSSDSKRKMYKEEYEVRPRWTSYAITTNETNFQKDSTGSRRFWVVEPKFITRPEDAGIDIKKVLGAIYNKLSKMSITERKQYCSLNGDEMIELREVNSKYYTGGNIGSILEEIFDVDTKPSSPVTKEELYLLVSLFDLNQKDHHKGIEQFFQANNIELRDESGRRLPKYKVGKEWKRGYLLWKINDDWDPMMVTNTKNFNDFEERRNRARRLKMEINNRSVVSDDNSEILLKLATNSESVIDEKIISENNIENANTSKLGLEKLMSGELVSNIEDGKRVPYAYKLHDNSGSILVKNYDSEVVELVDGTFVSFGSWRRFKTREELEDREGLQIGIAEEIVQEYCEADT